MRWHMWMMAAAVLSLTAIAGAEDMDPLVGIYKGTLGGKELRVDVVGRSKVSYDLVFYLPDAPKRATVKVRKESPEDTKGAFTGDVEFPDGEKAKASAEGTLDNGKISGSFSGAVSGEVKAELTLVESPTLGLAPPEGAIVLFDGGPNGNWKRHPEVWCDTGDGAMEVCDSSLVTTQSFGSGTWHAEFMTPYMPNSRGQARGNSGFYIQGRYEMQVLDSFGEEPMWDFCGGIYKVAKPIAYASLPPRQWQTYDIEFTAAQFDASGKKTANARLTAKHNGIVIHDNLELPAPTPGGLGGDDVASAPLMLQDHGDQVRYRNIWFVPAK